MDYLERLDKALEALEKEADRMTGLAKLSSTLGEVADELSAEKRQIKDATQDLRIATETIEKNTKELLIKYKEAEDLSEKKFKEINDNLDNIGKTILERNDLIDKHVDESRDAVEKQLELQLKDVQAEIDSSLKKISDKVDTAIGDVGSLRNEIEAFRASNEKTEKLHTILISIAILLSLVSCCLPFIH